MQKRNIYLVLSIAALFAILGFMVWDFFGNSQGNKNPYEYDLSDFKRVAEKDISHQEVMQIKVDIEVLRAIALDENGRVFASGQDKLLIYSADGQLEKEVATGLQAFCLFISKDEKLYMGTRKEILVFDLQGQVLDTIIPNIQNFLLTSLVVKNQKVYLADAGNKVVHQCDMEGNIISEFGKKAQTHGIDGFVIPSPYFDVAIGRNGELWAANTGRHQLESYSDEGQLIYSWAKTSMGLDGFSGCCNPSHFTFLSNGNFVTSEKGIERIKIISPNGEFLSVVAPPSAFEKGTKGIDLTVDSEDRIWAIDPKKSLIRVFAPKE